MNYSKILTIKDVENDEQTDNDNYILIINKGLITLISRNQLQHSFFLSDVESPVFALHERDDKTSHIRGMFFYCKSQRLLAELMMRNTWRAKREKFPSFYLTTKK